MNCLACGAIRSVKQNPFWVCKKCNHRQKELTEVDGGKRKICEKCGGPLIKEKTLACSVCGTLHAKKVLKGKKLLPTEEEKNILKEFQKYRMKLHEEAIKKRGVPAIVDYLRGKISFSDYECYDKGKIKPNKLYTLRLDYKLEEINGKVYIDFKTYPLGNRRYKRVKILTNISVEEFKEIIKGDPNREHEIKVKLYPSYDIHITKFYIRKETEIKYYPVVCIDINFPHLTVGIYANGGEVILDFPFPEKKVKRLLRRINRADSRGDTKTRGMLRGILDNIVSGFYFRVRSEILKEIREILGLKRKMTNVRVDTVLESIKVLSKLHGQYVKQGLKIKKIKSVWENCEKCYVRIFEKNPAYTSKTCPYCLTEGKIKYRNKKKILICNNCGIEMDSHHAAVKNLKHLYDHPEAKSIKDIKKIIT